MTAEWRRKRERRCHFKEKMSLEEAHNHRRPWIRAWRKQQKKRKGTDREKLDFFYFYFLFFLLQCTTTYIGTRRAQPDKHKQSAITK